MKEIILTQGKVTIVDDEDYEYLNHWKWRVVTNGTDFYAARWAICNSRERKLMYMHREIMKTPIGMEVDHINHDTLNNKKDNLRNCTHQQNKWNTLKRKNKLSKYLGVEVRFGKDSIVYRACIKVYDKTIHVGGFKEEKQAAMAYDKMAKEYFGEFANLNFPND